MNIENAKYQADTIDDEVINFAIKATIDGNVVFVPLEPSNSDYAEILRQVEAGDLTIAEAD
tara:strand:- start:1161 stop:1343 length:183 start_codon:yes stop_codon:yes gene_type:complete